MKKLTLVVVLVTATAWAGQTAVGNWLTRPEYKTLAATTYYVSPLGSDTGNCLDAGVGACATLTGVFAKLPPNINHAITINVAGATDGGIATYTGQAALSNVNMNAAITITGPSLVNATPTTGTATGALTAVTLGTVTVLTDLAQSWTTDDLIGTFITIGGVTRVVAVNTATTLTLASPFTSNPTIGNSYALQVPAAVFTSSVSGPTLLLRLMGNSAAGVGGFGNGPTFGITGVDFVHTASSATACYVGSSNHSVLFTNSRCRTTTGILGAALSHRGGGLLSAQASAFIGSGDGFSIATSSTNGSINPNVLLNPNNSLFYGGGRHGISTLSAGQSQISIAGSSVWTAQTASESSSAFVGNTKIIAAGGIATGPVFRCVGSSSASGYKALSNQAADPTPGSEIGVYSALIDGCTTGLDLSGGSGNAQFNFTTNGSLTCTGTTTCVTVANGSRVRLPASLSMQDGGTDISIDNMTYTATQLGAASPTRITNLSTGSTVWQ